MARPLFEIAKEISADWPAITPQAKSYLKGMFYLLGMDDRVADLDATTTVRMFLLYSKEWTGPVAERVKAELQGMRTKNTPTCAELLREHTFAKADAALTHCELCDIGLGSPAKYVDGYTHWGKRVRMCMHCNYCNSMGLVEGDGALHFTGVDGVCVKLHGEPKAPAAQPVLERGPATVDKPQHTLGFLLKVLGRKVIRRCGRIVSGLTKRSA